MILYIKDPRDSTEQLKKWQTLSPKQYNTQMLWSNQLLFDLTQGKFHKQELIFGTIFGAKNLWLDTDMLGPKREFISITLLDGHSIKLTSYDLLLYP